MGVLEDDRVDAARTGTRTGFLAWWDIGAWHVDDSTPIVQITVDLATMQDFCLFISKTSHFM